MPAEQTASANGVNVLMRTIGQAGSSAAVAAVLVHHTGVVGGAPVPTLHGYQLASRQRAWSPSGPRPRLCASLVTPRRR